jgi:hypothetical protein
MLANPPPSTPEVLPPAGLSPQASSPGRLVTLLKLWWLIKKWAWRNTAGALWLLLVYEAVARLSKPNGVEPFISSLPHWVWVGVTLWLLFLCEFQLTQLISFCFYVLTLPLWLPCVAIGHYFRNQLALTPFSVGQAAFKTRLLRVCIVGLLGALYLWWPLPSPGVAILLGMLALIPGFYLLFRTFRFALAPGAWMRRCRAKLHEGYEAAKKVQAAPGNTEQSKLTANQVLAWKTWLIHKYESTLAVGMERGLLRALAILYFSVLLFACLMYVGLLAALWLRGFAGTTEALAASLGLKTLPNLISVAFMCSLGVLGEWHIDASVLPSAATWVVFLLNIARIGVSVVLIATFFGGYSADVIRAESVASTPSPETPTRSPE